MGRRPCCSKEGLNRGAWTATEDKLLIEYIKAHGEGKWRNIPEEAGLKRCGKSCRLRWLNYLRPDIKRGNLTQDEEDLIVRLHKLLGNRWSLIAGRLPGRTDNEIKNYWNTKLSKKVQANQSKHSKTERKSVTNQAAPYPGVIRSKAVRCTRALVTPHQNKIGNPEAPSMDATSVQHQRAVESGSKCDGSSSFLSNEENSSEYMIDFDAGEMNLSEIFDSSFNKLSDVNDIGNTDNLIFEDAKNINDESNAKLPSFSGQAFLLNKELLLESWNASDFGSIASFLESSDHEWMI